jgi:hypothetical protein
MPFPHPIAILGFDRPDYLTQTLEGLRQALEPFGGQGTVALFLDGCLGSEPNQPPPGDLERRSDCQLRFQQLFPTGLCRPAVRNLGVAENMRRAYHWLFEELEAPVGLVLEDDYVMGPAYLQALTPLIDQLLPREDVSHVNATGLARPWPPDGDGGPGRNDRLAGLPLRPMAELWAFATSRRAWRSSRPLMEGYFRGLCGVPYRHRIQRFLALDAWWSELGSVLRESSQDCAETLVTWHLGRARVTTEEAYGRYIGVEGLHSTPETYAAAGYAHIQLQWRPPAPAPLESALLDALVAEIRRGETSRLSERTILPPDPLVEWIDRLLRLGAFDKACEEAQLGLSLYPQHRRQMPLVFQRLLLRCLILAGRMADWRLCMEAWNGQGFQPWSHWASAVAFEEAGDLAAATECWRLLALQPDRPAKASAALRRLTGEGAVRIDR